MADLDDFKNINDSYGHSVGDTVLQAFSELIRDQSRTEDLTARLGGEEFALLLPRTGADEAYSLAERIRSRLEGMDILQNREKVTASLGISELREKENLDKLVSRADKAMYRAKQNGKNRTEIIS
jgi:diguanylate cyclase (GGDEF)-like protein